MSCSLLKCKKLQYSYVFPVILFLFCHQDWQLHLLEKDTYCPPHMCQLHIALHEMSHLIPTATYEITVTVSNLHLRKLRLIEIKCVTTISSLPVISDNIPFLFNLSLLVLRTRYPGKQMTHKIKPALMGPLGEKDDKNWERISRLEMCELFHLDALLIEVVLIPWLSSHCIVNQDGLILARPFSYLEIEELPECVLADCPRGVTDC